jgi:hypothetical protein
MKAELLIKSALDTGLIAYLAGFTFEQRHLTSGEFMPLEEAQAIPIPPRFID